MVDVDLLGAERRDQLAGEAGEDRVCVLDGVGQRCETAHTGEHGSQLAFLGRCRWPRRLPYPQSTELTRRFGLRKTIFTPTPVYLNKSVTDAEDFGIFAALGAKPRRTCSFKP